MLTVNVLQIFSCENKVFASLDHPDLTRINGERVSAGWPVPNGTMTPHPTPPPNRKRRATLAVTPVILTLLVLASLVVSVNPSLITTIMHGNATPIVTITIMPNSQKVQDTYLMQGVASNANPDDRQVIVRQIASTKADTKQVTATGHFHQDATSATGTITFSNSSDTTQTVPSGTTFQVGNVPIVTDRIAVIPPATIGPPLQPGQTTIPAHAVQRGSAGNIAAAAINQNGCCGSPSISAQNPHAFAGGTNTLDYRYLQQDDVNTVASTNQTRLKNSAQNDVQGQIKAGEQLLSNINCDDPQITEDVPLNVPLANNITTVNVTVSVSCNAKVFDASAIRKIVHDALQQKVNEDPTLGRGYMLAGNITMQIQPQMQQNGSITFAVTAMGIWYYQWTDANKQALLNQIKGEIVKDALAILNSYPGVGKATIDISNGETPLPNDMKQIRLDVQPVNGL